MLRVSGVAKAHGGRVLFKDVSLQVMPGSRIALVGANGVGKTTLLEILAGDQTPDAGQVTRHGDVTVGYLRQEVTAIPGRSVLAEVMAGAQTLTHTAQRMRALEDAVARAPAGPQQESLLAEYGMLASRYEHLGGYSLAAQARRVLAGLGFAEHQMEDDIATFSGGWRMRVALARLLVSGADVLCLDEPTNHLDLDSVTWLQGFLRDYDGAVVLVSHDRDFINALATRVVELAGATATEYTGDFAAFVAQRAQRAEQQAATARNQQRKVAATEVFIERFRYKASKARQVQSRVKALDRLERVSAPRSSTKTMKLRFPQPARCGREVVRLERVAKSYGATTVYRDLDLVLERGQKVALLGPNGAGKSTLLKLLAGALPPDAGTRTLGHNVTVAYFAQHQVEALHPHNTVLSELALALDGATGTSARNLLGSFLFSGDDVDKRVAVLSGGEQTRLALAKLLCARANLLCLDEPTNHLDMASRDVLEDALAGYPGTVVLITHDRHLIRSVADAVVDVRDGGARLRVGDIEALLESGDQAASEPGGSAPTPAVDARADGARKRAEAEARNRRYQRTKDLRRRLERVEAHLVEAEAVVADLTRQMADPAVYADGEQVKALVARHHAAKDRAAALFTEWERLELAVERQAAQASHG